MACVILSLQKVLKIEIILELVCPMSIVVLLLEIPDVFLLFHKFLESLGRISLMQDKLGEFQLKENRLTLGLGLLGRLFLRILQAFLLDEVPEDAEDPPVVRSGNSEGHFHRHELEGNQGLEDLDGVLDLPLDG